ncbi:hypothetical protein Tco_1086960 [Tanacetum coccineum]
MRTRNSNFPNNSNVTIPRRRNKGRAPNIVEPELRTIVAPMAERTMEELLRAPTEGYGEAIVKGYMVKKEVIGEGDDREFVVTADVGGVLFGGGDEDDIETSRVSERCIREVVIKKKKNVVYIEEFWERHGVEKQRFYGVFGLERKDWLDLVGIGSKLQTKRRQENIVVPLKAVPYISGGPIYIREPPNI